MLAKSGKKGKIVEKLSDLVTRSASFQEKQLINTWITRRESCLGEIFFQFGIGDIKSFIHKVMVMENR
jgi:hypothetical protein